LLAKLGDNPPEQGRKSQNLRQNFLAGSASLQNSRGNTPTRSGRQRGPQKLQISLEIVNLKMGAREDPGSE